MATKALIRVDDHLVSILPTTAAAHVGCATFEAGPVQTDAGLVLDAMDELAPGEAALARTLPMSPSTGRTSPQG